VVARRSWLGKAAPGIASAHGSEAVYTYLSIERQIREGGRW